MRARHISVPRPGRSDQAGYLVVPSGTPRAGLVVVHEAFGLNEDMRRIAREFAEAGYAVLAVDLFSGGSRVACVARSTLGVLRDPTDNPGLDDLRVAVSRLGAVEGVNPDAIGVVGYCLGGGFALALACVDGRVAAASTFYGTPHPSERDLAHACPIIAHYPSHDYTRASAGWLEQVLERHGVPHDVHVYDNTVHSFYSNRPGSRSEVAAKSAWHRTLSFFETHLHPESRSARE